MYFLHFYSIAKRHFFNFSSTLAQIQNWRKEIASVLFVSRFRSSFWLIVLNSDTFMVIFKQGHLEIYHSNLK